MSTLRYGNPAAEELRRLAEGAGGAALVVCGDGNGCLFDAGRHRPPAATLLEAVLTFTAAGSAYPRILVASGTGPHLPRQLIVGKTNLANSPAVWWFRAPSHAPASREAVDEEDPNAALTAEWTKRDDTRGRVLVPLQGQRDWHKHLKDILTQVERACGWVYAGGNYIPADEVSRERTLVILDEAVLCPRIDQLDSLLTISDPDGHQLEDRLNGLPERLAKSSTDLLLLARSRAAVEALRQGELIRGQVLREFARNDPDSRYVRHSPAMYWPRVLVVQMRQFSETCPHGEYLVGSHPGQRLYETLCRCPPRRPPSIRDELRRLTGLQAVKDTVDEIYHYAQYFRDCQAAGLPAASQPNLHCVFFGNPGTGKTYVAGILARIFAETGLLSGRKVTAKTPADLIAGYVRQTGPQTRQVCEEASGGVLIIDEAYGLTPKGERDFGDEAINELLWWMTERRHDLAIIFAGYPVPMREFLRANPGLAGRVNYKIEFPDYSDEELVAIAHTIVARNNSTLADSCDASVLRRLQDHRRQCRQTGEVFRNAGVAERLIQAAISARARRLGKRGSPPTPEELVLIQPEDVEQARLDVMPNA